MVVLSELGTLGQRGVPFLQKQKIKTVVYHYC